MYIVVMAVYATWPLQCINVYLYVFFLFQKNAKMQAHLNATLKHLHFNAIMKMRLAFRCVEIQLNKHA